MGKFRIFFKPFDLGAVSEESNMVGFYQVFRYWIGVSLVACLRLTTAFFSFL